MRHCGKICGVFTAGILGSLIFMAPDTFSGDALFADLTTGSLPTATARADKASPNPAISRQLSTVKAAEGAYFDAAKALEVNGESAENLARLEAADDAYFEAVIALETAADNARQLARIEAADDAYFEAQMELEASDETGDMLAQIDAADDAYFKAEIALEGNIETRRRLAELKASEEVDFETIVAQMEAVDPSVTGSLPPAPGLDDLEDLITTATLSTQTEKELVMEEPSEAFLSQEPDRQELVMEEPGKEFPSQEPVRIASSAPVAAAPATPAEKAQRMPAPKTGAVAKTRSAKRVRSARLEARSAAKKKPVGPIRKLFRMLAKGFLPKPQQ